MFVSKRIKALEGELQAAQAQISDLTSQLNTANQNLEGVITAEAHQAIVQERDNLTAQVGQLQAQVAQLQGEQQSAGEQAADIVSSLGVPPVPPEKPGQKEGKTAAELKAEYDAITDPKAKADFWAQHSKSILR